MQTAPEYIHTYTVTQMHIVHTQKHTQIHIQTHISEFTHTNSYI